jgi:ribosomal protein S18 acetylase RimI-like enzyme
VAEEVGLARVVRETREAVAKNGVGSLEVDHLTSEDLPRISWSGGRTHIENVRGQLARVAEGEVEYLAARSPGGWPVGKCAIDYTQHEGAGSMFQLATLPELQGLGIARRLIAESEDLIRKRGLRIAMLAFEDGNTRARRIYERLGYEVCGEESASWVSEDASGRTFTKHAHLTLLKKELG